MPDWSIPLWGALGGVAVPLLWYRKALNDGKRPRARLIIVDLVSVALSALTALALLASVQGWSPFLAVFIGAAVPALLTIVLRYSPPPLPDSVDDAADSEGHGREPRVTDAVSTFLSVKDHQHTEPSP